MLRIGCWDTGDMGKKGKGCFFSESEVVSPWTLIDGILQNWRKMENNASVPSPDVGYQWNGLFASIGQTGMDVGGPSNPREDVKRQIHVGVLTPESSGPSSTNAFLEFGLRSVGIGEKEEEGKATGRITTKMKKRNVLKITIRNGTLRRLISGAVAGAVSRTVVAPLETIRTHLMVGSSGNSTTEVFRNIMETEGWKGLFRGNFVNVIRVAPSKAIELFAYDTVRKHLSHKPGESPKVPVPASLVAGAVAGISSTLCTYPLELVKTRITIQRDIYNNMLHAFLKIVEEEGPGGLYRGLTPSLIGVVPYAATNYFAYDTLRRAYKKVFKTEDIGNVATLLIGSAAGAISSSATFPLEVARKNMQVGAVSGRQIYRNMLHALTSILEKEGISGLYVGLGPSWMKLVPAAGISFMCYEACKRILVEKQDD